MSRAAHLIAQYDVTLHLCPYYLRGGRGGYAIHGRCGLVGPDRGQIICYKSIHAGHFLIDNLRGGQGGCAIRGRCGRGDYLLFINAYKQVRDCQNPTIIVENLIMSLKSVGYL